MSADNGVYIAQFKSREDDGPVFRVAYGSAIDNIHCNRFELFNAFECAQAFFNYEEAVECAAGLHEELGWTEYGICLISDYADLYWEDLTEEFTRTHDAHPALQ